MEYLVYIGLTINYWIHLITDTKEKFFYPERKNTIYGLVFKMMRVVFRRTPLPLEIFLIPLRFLPRIEPELVSEILNLISLAGAHMIPRIIPFFINGKLDLYRRG